MSYASLVIYFMLLAGPMLMLNAIAPGTVGPWPAALVMASGLFLIWLSTLTHSAFTVLRFAESEEELDNVRFFPRELNRPKTASPEERRVESAVAHSSTIS